MTNEFLDSAGAPLLFAEIELNEGATSSVFVAQVPCIAGRVLKAAPDAGLTVTARLTGSGAAFVDLQASPIDLSPYDGTLQSFDFEISAGSVADASPLQAFVRVAYA